MGCARWFGRFRPSIRVVAVDAVGSVTFGGEPGHRVIHGVGTSTRPALLEESYVDDVVHVEEVDTVRTCHRLPVRRIHRHRRQRRRGWLDPQPDLRRACVALAPDLGERYLATLYRPDWVAEHLDRAALDPPTVPVVRRRTSRYGSIRMTSLSNQVARTPLRGW